MSKKKILSESQIRRFMGLAGVGTLSNDFLGRTNLMEQEEEELPAEEPMDMAPEEELPAEEPEMEMGAEEPEMGGVGESEIEDLVSAIAAAIEQQTGVEVNVEGDAEEPEMDMAPEEELPAEEPEMEMDAEEEEPPMMEVVDEEEIVAEVYRRVAKRLNRMLRNR